MEKLITSPVLDFPVFKRTFILKTDASDFSMRAILAEIENDRKSHPVEFARITLMTAEKDDSTHEKKALAVIFGWRKCHVYLLYTASIEVNNDYDSLCHAF